MCIRDRSWGPGGAKGQRVLFETQLGGCNARGRTGEVSAYRWIVERAEIQTMFDGLNFKATPVREN